MLAMETDEILDVYVTEAIAVGQQEGVAPNVLLDAPDATAGHGVEAGLREGDAPVFAGSRVVDLDRFRFAESEGEVRPGKMMVEKPAFDGPAFVTQANDEVCEAVVGVGLHDVPENRPVANRDHRLGNVVGDVSNARPHTATQNYDLHAPGPFPFVPLPCVDGDRSPHKVRLPSPVSRVKVTIQPATSEHND